MSKPISPSELLTKRSREIPSEVIDIFNDLLLEKFSGGMAIIYLSTVTEKVNKHTFPAFEMWWLDVEDIYREQGWKVDFVKQSIGDSFKSHYVFRGEII